MGTLSTSYRKLNCARSLGFCWVRQWKLVCILYDMRCFLFDWPHINIFHFFQRWKKSIRRDQQENNCQEIPQRVVLGWLDFDIAIWRNDEKQRAIGKCLGSFCQNRKIIQNHANAKTCKSLEATQNLNFCSVSLIAETQDQFWKGAFNVFHCLFHLLLSHLCLHVYIRRITRWRYELVALAVVLLRHGSRSALYHVFLLYCDDHIHRWLWWPFSLNNSRTHLLYNYDARRCDRIHIYFWSPELNFVELW